MLLKFQNKTEHIVDDDDSWSGSYGGHVAMTPNQELSLMKSNFSGFSLAERLSCAWCLTHMKIYFWGTEVLVSYGSLPSEPIPTHTQHKGLISHARGQHPAHICTARAV
jgi:hypothetical protein